ncbi:tRNA pseudouridine(55) synthase TruB [Treponema primitia]|nr:tRNA pseudouridine(55) synthase TruB [Treponema primitia]
MTDSNTNGLLLLCKKPGLTSFDSLRIIKKALGTGKVGHTGTLDKFASGLLVVLSGRALKLTPWFDRCDKRYEAFIKFGLETDTLDPEGAVVAEGPVPSQAELEAVLDQFRGDILQAPPAYSAIHIEGKRAHELARSGAVPEMKQRPVTIHALELRSYEPPLAHIYVHCSKGTYIRSLARDLALAAGSRAHLVSLERTAVGGFALADAVSPDSPDLAGALHPVSPETFQALGIPCITVDEAVARNMAHGKPLDALLGGNPVSGPETAVAVFCTSCNEVSRATPTLVREFPASGSGAFVALIEKKPGVENRWSYGYVNAGA